MSPSLYVYYAVFFYSFFITQYITYLFTVCLLSLYSNLNKTLPTWFAYFISIPWQIPGKW